MATRTTFPSAPQLPQKPTSTSYENACRHILGQRFRQLLQKTTTLAAIIIPLSTLSLRGKFHCSIFSLICKNLVHIALAFVFGILPTLVARKIRRRAPQSPRPKTLAAEITSISPVYLAFHAVAGAALASVYAFFLGTHVDGLKFSFFTGSNRHPYSVNERHIVLVVGNTLLGVAYAALDAMSHRDPSWLRRFGGLTQRRSAATWKSVQRSCTFAVYFWPAFFITYLVLRTPAWAIINSLFGFILRPFLHFVLRSGSVWQLISWSLFWRMFVLQLSSLVMWDVAGEWFEINASQVIHLSQFKEDPNASLIAGLQSKDPYYKNFAFAELANVVSTRPPRRVALFSDLKANPTAWEQVCRECLLFLGRDYSAVVNRHVVPAPPAAAPAATAPARQGTSKIAKEGAYKSAPPTQHGPIDAFVGAANTVATVIPANLSVPAIFLSGSHSTASTEPTPASQTSTGAGWKLPQVNFVSLSSMALDILPPDMARWTRWVWNLFFVERQDAMLEGLLQGRAADVWAIEALSTLVSHSLHEDPYGRVQRDIPRVLEALVLYLGALEQLIDEVNANPTPDTEDAVKGVVQPVADALRDGIRLIVLEFGHRLAAFTFPPKIARRLQTMVDYL